tara:strand:+ start:1476 stop:2105 length:630 start_codon:yes stop_codon:yes gene_type:complete
MISVKENRAKRQLLWIGIGAIGMFFAGLTSAFIVRRAEGNWLNFALPDWFLYSTITIVISSFFLFAANRLIKQNKQSSIFVVLTFLLSIVFVYFQVKGWQDLTSQGVYLTGEGSNVAGSFLYVLTLSHLVHLVGGIVALIFAIYFSIKDLYKKDNMLGFKLISTYWHFLGALWIYLYFFLKYNQEGSISVVFNNILSQKNYFCNIIFTV